MALEELIWKVLSASIEKRFTRLLLLPENFFFTLPFSFCLLFGFALPLSFGWSRRWPRRRRLPSPRLGIPLWLL